MGRAGQTMLLATVRVARRLLFIYDYAPTAPSPPFAPPPPLSPPPAPGSSHGIVPAQRVALFAGAYGPPQLCSRSTSLNEEGLTRHIEISA